MDRYFFKYSSKTPGICGLSAPDSLHIYGCGIWNSPAYLIRSEDGGNTWTYTDMSAYADKLVDIHFLNKDIGLVSGTANPSSNGGIVLYTADGGNTWETKFKTKVPEEYIWKIQSPDKIHFFGSVNSLPTSTTTRMILSTDRGITWRSRIVKNNFYDVEMIGFADSLTGWTGGRKSLFKTTDGGKTWSDNLVNTSRNYNRFFLSSSHTAYLSGIRVYKQNFAEPVPPQPSPVDSITEHSISLSPNPTESFSKIDINFKQATFADLSLYSVEGKKLQTLLHGKVVNGKRTINIYLTKYLAGVYFLVLRTNEGFQNIKIFKR
ncbi:MAG: T9SS type A sorting domain-containing protein [Chitinophagaceae bacterium]